MRRNLAVLGCLLLLGGCVFRHGPRSEELHGQISASGVRVDVGLARGVEYPTRTLRGELLEVRDEAIALLFADRVTLIDLRAIDRLRPIKGSLAPYADYSDPASVGRALRRVSRYPQGMPSVALQRLLEASQQSEPTRITRQP
jgi:hypothetical protein